MHLKQQSRPQTLILKLADQVLPGDQSGHCDLLPEEVIPDRIHVNRAVRVFPADGIHVALNKRGRQLSGGDGNLLLQAVSCSS